MDFMLAYRNVCNDDMVIYTGYEEKDFPVQHIIEYVKRNRYDNIIVKVGGYVENSEPVWSPELGVELASSNQYAFKINIGN